jgi:ankyrin repeat protein
MGAQECLALLIAAGADIRAQNAKGWDAAMFAAAYGHQTCLRALITVGADIHASDTHGRTASMLATWTGHPATASLIENLALARDEASVLNDTTLAIAATPRPPRI